MKLKLLFLVVIANSSFLYWSKIANAEESKNIDIYDRQADKNIPVLVNKQRIKIEQFKFIGNTIFSSETLEELLSLYLQEEISSLLLAETARTITKYYSDRGYKSSFAVVVPRELNKGIVTLAITEGKIERIEVDITGFLNKEYVRARILRRFKNGIFNTNILAESIIVLTNDDNIKTINIDVDAESEKAGNVTLKAVVVASPIATVRAQFSNNRSPFTGNNEVIGQIESTIFGIGDKLTGITSKTQGSTGFGINYNLPVGINGNLNAFWGNNNDNIIQEPFDVGINNLANYFNVGYSHQLVNKPYQTLFIGATGSYSETTDSIQGRRFQFTQGADEFGELRVTALRFPVQYYWRDENDILSINSELSFGLGGVLNSTINESGVLDSSFILGRSSLEYAHLFSPNRLFYLRGVGQISNDSLPALERISFGRAVRGYPTSTGSGDRGIFLSAEYRQTIWSNEAKEIRLQLVPFVDFARIGNVGLESPQTPNLISAGIGLRFEISDRLQIILSYGEPLTERNNPNITGGKIDVVVTSTIFRF